MNIQGNHRRNQATTVNIFEQQELVAKAEATKSNLKASTWRELETKGKFDKNDKLSFIGDDMLILGCDIGSETHYIRAIDSRGRELSKSALEIEGVRYQCWELSVNLRTLNRFTCSLKIK